MWTAGLLRKGTMLGFNRGGDHDPRCAHKRCRPAVTQDDSASDESDFDEAEVCKLQRECVVARCCAECALTDATLAEANARCDGMNTEALLAYCEQLRQWHAAHCEPRRRDAERHRLLQEESDERNRLLQCMHDDGATNVAKDWECNQAHVKDLSTQPTFVPYVSVQEGAAHPYEIVESSVMACIKASTHSYRPSLSKPLGLSAPQIDAVAQAGACHSDVLPDGTRRGFYIADGTGVGKGRQAAAIIDDNANRGRGMHVWCTISTTLLADAQRDLTDVGCTLPLVPLHKMEYDSTRNGKDGIIFCTYSTLIAGNRRSQTRLDQLCCMLRGYDDAFDGVIVFDEAHRAKHVLHPADGHGLGEGGVQRGVDGLRTPCCVTCACACACACGMCMCVKCEWC